MSEMVGGRPTPRERRQRMSRWSRDTAWLFLTGQRPQNGSSLRTQRSHLKNANKRRARASRKRNRNR